METWQVGATVDLTFDSPLSISQSWGAELITEHLRVADGGACPRDCVLEHVNKHILFSSAINYLLNSELINTNLLLY